LGGRSEHLIIGTQKDNMNDSKLRKRQIKKLPREAVRKIRDAEEKTIQELAAEFGRTGSSIYKILKKISYSNIN